VQEEGRGRGGEGKRREGGGGCMNYKAMQRSGWLMDWEFLDVIWRFCIFSIYCLVSIYGPVWNCLAKVQDSALTIYPIFTYFSCYQVEIHGPARSSDVLRVTFACKREYFLQGSG